MAKKIPCELWIGTSTRFFKWGDFDSVSEAKKYVRDTGMTCYKEYRKKKQNEIQIT